MLTSLKELVGDAKINPTNETIETTDVTKFESPETQDDLKNTTEQKDFDDSFMVCVYDQNEDKGLIKDSENFSDEIFRKSAIDVYKKIKDKGNAQQFLMRVCKAFGLPTNIFSNSVEDFKEVVDESIERQARLSTPINLQTNSVSKPGERINAMISDMEESSTDDEVL